MGDLYRELVAAAAEVGEAGGYDAVVRYAESEVQPVTLTDLQLQIGTQAVLWRQDAHDLTPALLAKLNAQ